MNGPVEQNPQDLTLGSQDSVSFLLADLFFISFPAAHEVFFLFSAHLFRNREKVRSKLHDYSRRSLSFSPFRGERKEGRASSPSTSRPLVCLLVTISSIFGIATRKGMRFQREMVDEVSFLGAVVVFSLSTAPKGTDASSEENQP